MLSVLSLLPLLTIVKSAVSHDSSSDFVCTTTGPSCVRDCEGLPNGPYQSCRGCHVFVICKKDYMKDNNPCPIDNSTGEQMYFNDVRRECVDYKSDTCHLQNITDHEEVRPSGAIYTRWGRRDCPPDNEQIYSGYAAGGHTTQAGGGTNMLCMVPNPVFGTGTTATNTRVYGTEYETGPLTNKDMPCAVCKTHQKEVLMFPGTNICYPGFVTEYVGYLATSYSTHTKTSNICVDGNPEAHGKSSTTSNDGVRLYPAEAICGSLPCSVYPSGKDLLCVVCSC